VHAIDTATGAPPDSFESGNEPHESNTSFDGTRIYHAAIGRVFLPTEQPGARRPRRRPACSRSWTRATLKVLETYHMESEVEGAGDEWIHEAVRPMARAPDGRFHISRFRSFTAFFEFESREEGQHARALLAVP
jgi:hypothetical protein